MNTNEIKKLAHDIGGDDAVAMVERIDAAKKEFGMKVHELQIETVQKYAPEPGVAQAEIATAICEAMSAAYAGIAASLGKIMDKDPEEINALAVKSLKTNLDTCWDTLDEMDAAKKNGENEYAAHG